MEPPLRLVLVCCALAAAALPAKRLAAQEKPAAAAPPNPAPGKAAHAVIVVCDGLRPDCVTDALMPNLSQLARDGVFFAHHHSVYPTSTEVNGTALATGCHPGRSGIVGNREYRPAINPLATVADEALETIRKGDAVSGGKYLAVPTLAEICQQDGSPTAIADTKPVVLLMDRAERRESEASRASVVVYAGNTLPEDAREGLDKALGTFPRDVLFPNTDADAWTTRALTEYLWKDGLAKYSVLWLSDPDYSQHHASIGAKSANEALKSVDRDLGVVLAALDKRGWRDKTDVFVVSDHGFSTISRALNMAELLTKAGFSARREFQAPMQRGDILVDGLGGTVYFYVAEHDPATAQRLVNFLQESDFAGVIFSRETLPGCFPLDTIKINSPEAPDVAVALRWTNGKNAAGYDGQVISDGGRGPGQGTHCTLSPSDTHNTLIAAGPDLRRGWRDELPSANIDVAPTVAHLLGLKLTQAMDGRILREALVGAGDQIAPDVTEEKLEAAVVTDRVRWRQFLQISRCEGSVYFNEGSSETVTKNGNGK